VAGHERTHFSRSLALTRLSHGTHRPRRTPAERRPCPPGRRKRQGPLSQRSGGGELGICQPQPTTRPNTSFPWNPSPPPDACGIRAKRRIACQTYLNPQAKASLPFVIREKGEFIYNLGSWTENTVSSSVELTLIVPS